jgi:hypothetical protein
VEDLLYPAVAAGGASDFLLFIDPAWHLDITSRHKTTTASQIRIALFCFTLLINFRVIRFTP